MASVNTYILNNKEYPIEIIRKNNKNTYLRVKEGKIIVTTNYLTSSFTINKLIKDNTSFINKVLLKDNQKKEDTSFKLFGITYDIVYGFPNTEIEDNKIYTKDEKTLNKYLSKYITNIYKERLDHYYNIFEEQIPIPNLKIRKMTSRWGVCNIKNHNVTLNSELSKYNIECLNYVIVHELSHFIHPNHSKNFWLQVGGSMKHNMNLNNRPFKSIKEGTKTIELRLNDEKRSLLKVGDEIEFTNRDTNEKLSVDIINLYKYPSFKELYKHFNKIEMGYAEDEPAESKDMEAYYSKEEQEKYGVLGIEIRKK